MRCPKNRAGGGGCAGCAQAHPIFGSSLSKDYVYSRKLWSWVLVCTPNVQWLPPALNYKERGVGRVLSFVLHMLTPIAQQQSALARVEVTT